MPTFFYKAYSHQGKAYLANIESSSLLEAKKKLTELDVIVVFIKEKRSLFSKKITKQSLFQFTNQLYQLVEASFPLYEALELLKEQFIHDPIYSLIDSLSEKLKSGSSFSHAIKNYPQYFDALYCTLIEVGEESGSLPAALKGICKDFERKQKLSKQLSSALIYPSILIAFCTLLINLLIFYIIPSLSQLFDGAKPGGFTQTVMSVCAHLKQYGSLYFLFFVSICLGCFYIFKIKRYKKIIDETILKIWGLNSLIIERTLARWTSTMTLLLNGGVDLMIALKLAQDLITNSKIKSVLNSAQQKISEGSLLSHELKKETLFPKLLIRMIYIGENSGELAQSFDRLSKIYEELVDQKMAKIMTLISPIILIVMGAIIGVIMLAILIPLTDINAFTL